MWQTGSLAGPSVAQIQEVFEGRNGRGGGLLLGDSPLIGYENILWALPLMMLRVTAVWPLLLRVFARLCLPTPTAAASVAAAQLILPASQLWCGFG